jgi:voltage-gated potassium channel Kch
LKKKIGLLGILVTLLVLSVVLFIVESGAQGSSINSIWDALWYMVVTLTTVGYGDVYPVTVFGKILGIVFVLSSMGILGFIIASVAGIVNDDVKPAIFMKKHKSEDWYVFSEYNIYTEALIEDIKKTGKGICICLSSKNDKVDDRVVYLDCSMEKIINSRSDMSGLHLIFDGEGENYNECINACKSYINDNVLPFHCYCMTEYVPEVIPVNLTFFNKYENTGRLYWNSYPLRDGLNSDECIIIIGMGKYGAQILEQALKSNVLKVNQSVEYHVFGDSKEFQTEHYYLGNYFSVGKKAEDRDSIFFYETDWREERAVIEKASRIIFCNDDNALNLTAISKFRKYFVSKNPDIMINVLSEERIDDTDISAFGTLEEVYTVDLVLKDKLSRVAMKMHDIYVSNNGTTPDWNHISEFSRQSNIAVADHVDTKLKVLKASSPKEAFEKYNAMSGDEKVELWNLEHERWMRFHVVNNWHYAGERNNGFREHNMLVPFDDLPFEEKAKDGYSWEVLGKL